MKGVYTIKGLTVRSSLEVTGIDTIRHSILVIALCHFFYNNIVIHN